MQNLILKDIQSLYLLKEVRKNLNTIEDLINNDFTDDQKIVDILVYLDVKTKTLNEKHVGVIPSYLKVFEEVDLEEFKYYLFNYMYPEVEELIKAYDDILLNKFIKNSFMQ